MTVHTIPTADRLGDAARASIRIQPDPQTGRRADDPLHTYITGDGQASAEIRALVEFITGRRIGDVMHTAPACRAALRRWALRNQEGN